MGRVARLLDSVMRGRILIILLTMFSVNDVYTLFSYTSESTALALFIVALALALKVACLLILLVIKLERRQCERQDREMLEALRKYDREMNTFWDRQNDHL